MSVNKVKIVHPETNQESEVVETSVAAWETVGWTRAEDGDSQKEQEETVEPGDQVVVPAESPVPQTATAPAKVKNGGPVTPDTSKKE